MGVYYPGYARCRRAIRTRGRRPPFGVSLWILEIIDDVEKEIEKGPGEVIESVRVEKDKLTSKSEVKRTNKQANL